MSAAGGNLHVPPFDGEVRAGIVVIYLRAMFPFWEARLSANVMIRAQFPGASTTLQVRLTSV